VSARKARALTPEKRAELDTTLTYVLRCWLVHL